MATTMSPSGSDNAKRRRELPKNSPPSHEKRAAEGEADLLLRECDEELHRVRAAEEAETLLMDCDEVLRRASDLVGEAGALVARNSKAAGGRSGKPAKVVPESTGGYCNTDHSVRRTGDDLADRIAEYKRLMEVRRRWEKPESRDRGAAVDSSVRWDRPKKIPGSRRRRINPPSDAPPRPPPSGYTCFLGQFTAKFRHDSGLGGGGDASAEGCGEPQSHRQALVLKDASDVWNNRLNDSDRKYYGDLIDAAKAEHEEQVAEYKATGHYRPGRVLERVHPDVNLWVNADRAGRSDFEREVSGFGIAFYEALAALQRRSREGRRADGSGGDGGGEGGEDDDQQQQVADLNDEGDNDDGDGDDIITNASE